MSYADLLNVMALSEIHDGLSGTDGMTQEYREELALRKTSPALQEAYENMQKVHEEFCDASDRYNVLYRLLKVTEKF